MMMMKMMMMIMISMPSGYASLKVFSVHASRLFGGNLRASLGVSFFSVTSAGCRRLHLGGLDLPLILQGSPLVLPVLCDLLQLSG